MERKLFLKDTRRRMNQLGVILLADFAIVNLLGIACMLFDLAGYLTGLLIRGEMFDIDAMMAYIYLSLTSNGWGYILAIVVGIVIVNLWKGRSYWKQEVFVKGKTMTVSVFFQLVAVFLTAQLFGQVFIIGLEALVNTFGMTAVEAVEMASGNATGFSMYLYACILGPIGEELLFRGLVLRTLKPWGKQTAIVVSAILFGVFHGNLAQIPFAFLVGLMLGYVAVEYSVIWSIALHIFNNWIFADLLDRVLMLLPGMVGVWLSYAILPIIAVVAVVLLIVKRDQVKAFFTQNRCHGLSVWGVVTSPAVLVFIIMMLLLSLVTITPM